MTLRTRFAPSPTGFLHIGGARTALFCHLHTRRFGGVTILRIEDTDQERSSREAVDGILEGLHWMGLDPDEGPYFQSDHTANYLAQAERLLQEGQAYRCICSKEALDSMREEQRTRGIKPRYDRRCRDLQRVPEDGVPYVIRFKTPITGEVVWNDGIQGTICISNEELDDLILVRSDGSPTYNLAVVVDDHDMGITQVIRGEDHISNTPRQIHLFQALAWPVPKYAHMPLLHGSDGAKLSKRHGAVSVLQYREDGFLPVAVNNYLVRLGWSHGDQEIFTMAQMEQWFNIVDVGRSATIFNNEKLLWINGHHIRSATPADLKDGLIYQLAKLGIESPDPAYVERMIPEFQERSKTLVEMAEKSSFLFKDDIRPYAEKAAKKYMKLEVLPPLIDLVAALRVLPSWQAEEIERVFKATIGNHHLDMGQLAQPVRIALTGTAVSPGIYETLVLLGREQSLQRLAWGVDYLSAQPK